MDLDGTLSKRSVRVPACFGTCDKHRAHLAWGPPRPTLPPPVLVQLRPPGQTEELAGPPGLAGHCGCLLLEVLRTPRKPG